MGMLAFVACSAAILWWGWASDRLGLAIPMSIALHLAIIFRPSWSLAQKALKRSTSLTIILIAFSAVGIYLGRQDVGGNLAIHALLLFPLLLFPKLLLHAFALGKPSQPDSSRVDGAAAVRQWLSQSAVSHSCLDAPFRLDFVIAYLFFCVFSAASSSPPAIAIAGSVFFVLLSIALTGISASRGASGERPRRFFRGLPFVALSLATILVMALGGLGIQQTQEALEERMSRFFDRFSDLYNPNIAQTSIGKSGRMSLPNKLLYRVDWPETHGYLFDGAFSHTPDGVTWLARPPAPRSETSGPPKDPQSLNGGRRLFPNDDGSFSVSLPAAPGGGREAIISTVLSRDRQALPLPPGAASIFGLPLPFLEVSRQNAISSQGTPGFVKFSALYDPALINLPPPEATDTSVPARLVDDLDAFISTYGLEGLPPHQAAAKIQQIFSSWEYTLDLETPDGAPRSLRDFLFSDRRGHCEYFASASSLLLRRMNIPARFVSGYQVSEKDDFEKVFWVRSSDGHAWSSYWDGSKWAYLDATPAGFPEPPFSFSMIGDWLDRLQYAIDTADRKSLFPNAPDVWPTRAPSLALLLLIPLAGFFLFRRRRPVKPTPQALCESLVFEVEALCGLRREPFESSPSFLRRASARVPFSATLLLAAKTRESALFERSIPEDPTGPIEAALQATRAERRRSRVAALISKARRAPGGP